ncbi:hypothetical protein BH10PLA2_BH10PLA2_20520 [soil metagenome]
MTNWNPRANELFLDALKRPTPLERHEYLDGACAGDKDLRADVESLLEASVRAGSFMAAPVPAFSNAGDVPQAADCPGKMIGPYKLLQQIGEGGMGVVYMAEQHEPVRRRVALKIIKPGMNTAQVLGRFESERLALALMDHPNIARVLDGGTTETGRPYFVMELVNGVAITEYCDENQLTPRERLGLFVPVCQAIQHAHQKGIIHRDVKPSNVMVTLYDGRPVPKVIDFGVAKAIEQRLTERTQFTAYGQLVGTLEYMSPEQAALSGQDVDTRSDIYSLGVLAYELLTGSTPLQRKTFRSGAYVEILRLIREQEPPRPSSRLSDSGEGLAAISAQRNMEPGKLRRLVSGELDWIVMKALDKERGRRYETASALARDVERYLADEAVKACPPSRVYVIRKFWRRNKGTALAVAVVALSMVGGIAGTSWGMVRAGRARNEEAAQRQRAEANEKKALAEKQVAEAVQAFLQRDLLRQADAVEQANANRKLEGQFEAKDNPTIKDLLDRAAAALTPIKIEARFPGQRQVQASILLTVGETYRGIGEFGKAAEFLTRASEIYREDLGAEHTTTISTLQSLAWAYQYDGQMKRAIEMLERVREAQIRKLGGDHANTLDTKVKLAVVYRKASMLPQAIELLEQVRDAQAKLHGENDPTTLNTTHDLIWATYLNKGGTPKTIQQFASLCDRMVKALGPDHPDTLGARADHAIMALTKENVVGATLLLEQVREALIRVLGPDHPNTLANLHNLAVAYVMADKLPQAIEILGQVYEAKKKKLGADHPATLTTWAYLASVHKKAGNPGQALAICRQVAEAEEKRQFQDEYSGRHVASLISSLEKMQLYTEAETWWRKWLTTVKENKSTDLPVYAASLEGLGANLLLQEKWSEAAAVLRERQALTARLKGKQPVTIFGLETKAAWVVPRGKSTLGQALVGAKEYDAAIPVLLTAYEEINLPEDKWAVPERIKLTKQALESLARLYEAKGNSAQAKQWRQRLAELANPTRSDKP